LNAQASNDAPRKVTIAYQLGLAYYPLLLIKQQKILERQFPNTAIEWRVISGPTPIRDGMISNQIHMGTIGVPTFLMGRDKGLDWKLLAGLVQQEFWLVVNDPRIKTLQDFQPDDKIAVPDQNSVPAITLRIAAQQQLGDPKALDLNLQSLPHSQGMQALEAKQVAAHFAVPPFQWQEVKKGGRAIVNSADLVGGLHTGIGLVTMQSFYKQYPVFNQFFYKAVEDAARLLRENPDEAAKLVVAESEGKTHANCISRCRRARAETTLSPLLGEG
jgi:NitT/TauT family transport system substrate-binding protein